MTKTTITLSKRPRHLLRGRCTVIFVDIVLCCDEDAKSPHNLQNYLHVVLARFVSIRCDAKFLQLKYDVPSFETAAEFLALIKASSTLAKKKKGGKGGNGEKGGEPNLIDGTLGI